MLTTSTRGEKASKSGNKLNSERLRDLPSDILEEFGIDHARLSPLGTEDAAKLVDGLQSVGSYYRPQFEY